MYAIRTYRNWVKDKDLTSFTVKIGESDLFIRAEQPLISQARESLQGLRRQIQGYIQKHPEFAAALKPYSVEEDAPEIVRKMAGTSANCGLGPMAAVAGAIAEYVGNELLKYSAQVIVENGGDIFIKTNQIRRIGLFAGKSPYTGKLALEIVPGDIRGVCTSSGTVGPSLSFGRADAAVAACDSAILADAWATCLGNMVKSADDLDKTLRFAQDKPELKGVIIIIGDKIAAQGKVKLVTISNFK